MHFVCFICYCMNCNVTLLLPLLPCPRNTYFPQLYQQNSAILQKHSPIHLYIVILFCYLLLLSHFVISFCYLILLSNFVILFCYLILLSNFVILFCYRNLLYQFVIPSQNIAEKRFGAYDWQCKEENTRHYGQPCPPECSLDKITPSRQPEYSLDKVTPSRPPEYSLDKVTPPCPPE